MKRIFLPIALTLVFSFGAAAQTTRCYRLTGLKGEDSITLRSDGAKVKGDYIVRRDYNDTMTEHYSFSGTITGDIITVRFANKKPEPLPDKEAKYTWTILPAATGDKLRVQFYGKDYRTNKYGNYFAEFESCEPSVDSFLATSPEIVKFARGQHSAAMKVKFPDTKGYRTYLVGARIGQTITITAPGCAIRVYLPDKRLFEYDENPGQADSGKAAVALDLLSISPTPQMGIYLIALQAVGDVSAARDVKFEITN